MFSPAETLLQLAVATLYILLDQADMCPHTDILPRILLDPAEMPLLTEHILHHILLDPAEMPLRTENILHRILLDPAEMPLLTEHILHHILLDPAEMPLLTEDILHHILLGPAIIIHRFIIPLIMSQNPVGTALLINSHMLIHPYQAEIHPLPLRIPLQVTNLLQDMYLRGQIG